MNVVTAVRKGSVFDAAIHPPRVARPDHELDPVVSLDLAHEAGEDMRKANTM